MTEKIEDDTKKRIAAFLPDAIGRALTSYHEFMQTPESKNNAKTFKDYHSACKVAIAHIELLIKLARWADLPDAKADDHNNQIILATMMQEAEEELAAYKQKSADTGEA